MKNRITKQIYLFLYLLFKQTINRIMNLREKVNALFAKHNVSLTAEETVVDVKQMVEAILADGTSIYSDSDTWAVGVRAFAKDMDGNEVALMDGEYTTAEGLVVVVTGGLVEEIADAAEEAPEAEVEPVDVVAEEQASESLSAEVEGLLSLVAKLESELADAKKANENLSSEVTKLSAQPAAPSIKEVKQAKVSAPSKSYNKMSAEERFVFHLNK
jgi:FtsZ-binding cell division protein ZapB